MKRLLLASAFTLTSSLTGYAYAKGPECELKVNDQVVPMIHSNSGLVGSHRAAGLQIGDVHYTAMALGGEAVKNNLSVLYVEIGRDDMVAVEKSTKGSSSIITGNIVLSKEKPYGYLSQQVTTLPSGDTEVLAVVCKIAE